MSYTVESARATHAAFCDRTLPKAAWTHEAHLMVCWVELQRRSPAEALDHLRTAIRAYNEATGTPNTDMDGYHETITRYYVWAVDSVDAADPAALVDDTRCSRTAPLLHWSRARLFSVPARRGWVEPDLAPLG